MALQDFIQKPERVKSTSISFTDETLEMVDALAKEFGVNRSRMVMALVEQEYERQFEPED